MAAPKVVIVDDEEDICEILSIALTARGFDVATANDGVEGLKLIRRTRPAVAVVDIQMPRMNGYDLILRLSEDPSMSGTRVIVATSLTQDGSKSDDTWSNSLGVSGFMTKPFNPSDLADCIDRILAGRS